MNFSRKAWCASDVEGRRFDGTDYIFGGTRAGEVKASTDGDKCTLSWNGNERVEVSFSRAAGLLQLPVTIRVDGRLSLNGFDVVFNGKQDSQR